MARAKKMVPAVLGVMVLVAAGTAFAWGGPGGGYRGDGMGTMRGVYSLPDLTDSQRQSLNTLRAEHAPKMQAAARAMRDAHIAVRDAMADGADGATVRPLAEKAAQAQVEMSVLRAENHAAMSAVLTDAQRSQLADLRFSRGPGGASRFGGQGPQFPGRADCPRR